MDIFTIIVLSIGLSMDSLAVSIACGITIKKTRIIDAVKIGLFFSIIQAFFLVFGWIAGFSLRSFISEVDHWVAFILLGMIGSKMIIESFKNEGERKQIDPLKNHVLLLLAIATSIDALAVGLGFAILQYPIAKIAAILGIVTFVFAFNGTMTGDRIGNYIGGKIKALGGLILIGIGIKILIEHLS
ncbi:manganese efflux pump MntP family protein [candidate division KSB1 bacterium]